MDKGTRLPTGVRWPKGGSGEPGPDAVARMPREALRVSTCRTSTEGSHRIQQAQLPGIGTAGGGLLDWSFRAVEPVDQRGQPPLGLPDLGQELTAGTPALDGSPPITRRIVSLVPGTATGESPGSESQHASIVRRHHRVSQPVSAKETCVRCENERSARFRSRLRTFRS